jgi:hypothetical protein
MKKYVFITICMQLAIYLVVYAQDCATGYCPQSITMHHVSGDVSPQTVTIAYVVVEADISGTTKCWIAQNLGATTQAASATDDSDAAAGWYWQFNRMQGYYYDSGSNSRTPPSTWITSIDEDFGWISDNDPCTLLLGSNWRLPTYNEWNNADSNESWGNYTNTYSSALSLHAAGNLSYNNCELIGRGSYGYYWSSTKASATNGYYLYFHSGSSVMTANSKAGGRSVRCLRTY